MRRMILILCSVLLAQASTGGTFVYDVPYSGPSVTSEILEPAESGTPSHSMVRVTYEPGGVITAHAVSASTIYYITSGTMGCEVLSGEARVVRAMSGDMTAEQAPIMEEVISVGQEVTLNAGDTVYYERGAVQTERNDGDTPAIVLVTIDQGSDEGSGILRLGDPQ